MLRRRSPEGTRARTVGTRPKGTGGRTVRGLRASLVLGVLLAGCAIAVSMMSATAGAAAPAEPPPATTAEPSPTPSPTFSIPWKYRPKPDTPGVPPTQPETGSPSEPDDEDSGESVICNLPVASEVCDAYGGAKRSLSFASDPFGYIGTMIQKAIGSVLKLFAQLIDETSSVDWGNEAFLRTYTMMFGLATFVTAFLWLISVGKRVVAGVGPAEAVGESIGYLLIAVVVTAFAPAAVALLTDLVDEASAAMFRPVLGDITDLADTLAKVWVTVSALGGGSFLVVTLGSFLLFAVVSVWAELVVRSALLYVALVFGPLTFAGLVDRALWNNSKRWLGATVAVIISKPVTLTVLALATGVLREFTAAGAATDPLTALRILFLVMALFFLAFLLPVAVGKFVPAFGDELAAIAAARRDATEQVRGSGPSAKEGAETMGSTTGGRLDAASEMVQKGIDKFGGAGKAPVGADGEDGEGVPDPTGAEEAGEASGKAAGGAEAGATGATEAAATGAAGPAGAVKQTVDEVKEFLGDAAKTGAARATGEDVGGGSKGGDSGGGEDVDIPPPDAPPLPDDHGGQR